MARAYENQHALRVIQKGIRPLAVGRGSGVVGVVAGVADGHDVARREVDAVHEFLLRGNTPAEVGWHCQSTPHT